jgi:predicted esterase
MTVDPHGPGAVLHFGVEPADAKAAVVLLHGRGGSARDILRLAQALALPDVAFFAPEAAGNTWYPLSFLASREENEPYLSSALHKVEMVVRGLEESGLTRSRIVVGGFSQGACLATEFVAHADTAYGGLVALTGGLIGPPEWVEAHDADAHEHDLTGMRAYFGSGDPDPHVPWSRVEASAARLRAKGAAVTLQRFPGRQHTVSPEEIEAARALIQALQANRER